MWWGETESPFSEPALLTNFQVARKKEQHLPQATLGVAAKLSPVSKILMVPPSLCSVTRHLSRTSQASCLLWVLDRCFPFTLPELPRAAILLLLL